MPDAAKPPFMQRQYEFAAHIRDPDNQPAPDDIEDRRMGIYRELFYNNVEGFLSSSFPVLRKLMDDASWHAMARDFYARHRCHSPLFLEIPREFLNYLQHERIDQADDLPFLWELAHYEWVELALSVADSDDGEHRHSRRRGRRDGRFQVAQDHQQRVLEARLQALRFLEPARQRHDLVGDENRKSTVSKICSPDGNYWRPDSNYYRL